MRAQNYRLSFFSFNFAIQNQLRGELWKKKEKEITVKIKEPKPKKKVSKTWEAIQKLKGSVIINDPTLLL